MTLIGNYVSEMPKNVCPNAVLFVCLIFLNQQIEKNNQKIHILDPTIPSTCYKLIWCFWFLFLFTHRRYKGRGNKILLGGGHDRKLDGLEEDRIEGKGSIQLAVVKLERIPKTQGSEVPTIFAIPDETVCLEKG